MSVKSELRKIAEEVFGNDIEKTKKDRVFFMPLVDKPEIMIIMQNPGTAQGWELDKLDKAHDLDKCLGIYNKALLDWLKSGKDFFEFFFQTINKFFTKLSKPLDRAKISEIFYFSDLCKLRTKRNIIEDYHMILREINIVKPKLILCFGGMAWSKFYNSDNISIENQSQYDHYITQIHGDLLTFNNENVEIPFIPLVHMSPQAYGLTIKDSYFENLEEGLEEYNSL